MKKLLLLFSTLALSFLTLADNHHLRDFSLSEFCYEQPDVQNRNGVYYLPNQSVGITATSVCVYKDAYGQYSSKGNIVKGYFDGLWTGWDRNGEIWLETYYINRKVVPIVCRDDLLDFFKDETYYDDYGNPLTAFNRCDKENSEALVTFDNGAEIINGKREGSWDVMYKDRGLDANYTNGKLDGAVVNIYYGKPQIIKNTNSKFFPIIKEFNEIYKDGELVSQELTLDQTDLVDETDPIDEMILAIEKESALRSAYINNIAAKVRTHWRFQGAGYDWTAEVYVAQDRDGTVLAVDIRNTNVGDSNKAKTFINSIERAVYKASPLPLAPDDSVFNEQLIFTFKVNE
jgi:hypothetical protein